MVERVPVVQAKKETSHFVWTSAFIPWDGRPFSHLSFMPEQDRICSSPTPKIAVARSFICSDHVRANQEPRFDGVLLEPGPQVRQEQPHCREERTVTKSEGGAFLRHSTWGLTCRPVFALTLNEQLFLF